MINGVKDSLLMLMMAGIFYGIYIAIQHFYGQQNAEYSLLAMALFMAFWMPRVFAALGASLLMGTAYDANKSKYALSAAIFHEDKKSSTLHMLVVMFFMFFGMILYPLALLVSLINIKSFFARDEAYEMRSALQESEQNFNDESDPTVNTGSKKFKLHINAFESYYFHTKKEAIEYSIYNDKEGDISKI